MAPEVNLTRLHFTGKSILYLFLGLVAFSILAVIAYSVTQRYVMPAINKIPGASKVTGGAGQADDANAHPAMAGL